MSKVVHIIDDDQGVADSIAYLLRIMGYTAYTYDSGLSFFERAQNYHEGCVITDVRMPGIGGVALTAQLRSLGSKVPIIMISGDHNHGLDRIADRAGATTFIEKPFDDDILLEALGELESPSFSAAH
jgi:two-component system response regulator FixJ